MSTRKEFLKQAGSGLGLATVLPTALTTALTEKELPLLEDKVVLFQGDSITDGRRNREAKDANHAQGLGNGYAFLVASQMLGSQAGSNWKFYNRGISGNKVYQLEERWSEDAITLKPDVISILIGVNDYWHMLKHGYEGTLEKYEKDYRALLVRTTAALPQVKLIVGEPFAIKGGTAIEEDLWFPEFDAYRAAAKRIALDFNAVFIPYQKIFDKALVNGGPQYWCPDGVHPSLAGSYLMAKHWIKALKRVV